MATKKLKAELEVDTSKARAKVAREFAETGGAAAGGGGGVHDLPTRDLRELGNAARETGARLSSSGRMFAGLAMGMARAAVAGSGDPTATAAVGAIGSIAGGAAIGGLPGAIAAAVSEAVAAAIGMEIDKNQKLQAEAKTKIGNLEALKEWDEARARTLAFKETLESLTNVTTDAAERQQRLAEEIKKRVDADKEYAREMVRESGDQAAFARAMAKRNANAAELDRLRELEKQKPSGGGGAADWHGLDALSSVGGMFAGSGAGARAIEDLADTADEQLRVLKNIERNTQDGGATWQ